MPAGSTYTPIATTTLGTSATSVTFSSISGSYTDLVLVAQEYTTGTPTAFGISCQFNGDTASNYSTTYLYGTGSSAASGRATAKVGAWIGFESYSANWTVITANFQNYSNSTTYKTVLSRSSDSANLVGSGVSLWRSTAAITSIKVLSTDFGSGSTPFVAGSTFTLYGIASA